MFVIGSTIHRRTSDVATPCKMERGDNTRTQRCDNLNDFVGTHDVPGRLGPRENLEISGSQGRNWPREELN